MKNLEIFEKYRNVKAPKKYRSEIMNYCKKYEALSNPKEVIITFPSVCAEICWDFNDEVSVYGINYDVEKSPEIIKYNKKIKLFVKSVDLFGKVYFKDKGWLWKKILWRYDPENGEKMKTSDIRWI